MLKHDHFKILFLLLQIQVCYLFVRHFDKYWKYSQVCLKDLHSLLSPTR